jgi:hypothetical protein
MPSEIIHPDFYQKNKNYLIFLVLVFVKQIQCHIK